MESHNPFYGSKLSKPPTSIYIYILYYIILYYIILHYITLYYIIYIIYIIYTLPIGSMYAIYGNMDPINIPQSC